MIGKDTFPHGNIKWITWITQWIKKKWVTIVWSAAVHMFSQVVLVNTNVGVVLQTMLWGQKGQSTKTPPTRVVKTGIIIPKNEKISKDRDEEKESLKNEVKELRQMMEKMIQAQSETNKCFHKTLDNMIGKVGNNTYNNKMSINVYLNEYCKDAMNLTDFVDKLKVSLEDLMYTKDHGYVKGISNIFVKQLQDMKPTERPIHCSDKKRLQFYVKNENKWEKRQDT